MDAITYNLAILQVWEEFVEDGHDDERVPLLYPPLVSDGLVFVGLNPSFSARGWEQLRAYLPIPNFDANRFFAWRDREVLDVEVVTETEIVARDWYAYFRPERQFASSLGVPWEHVDIFAYRHRDQRVLAERVLLGGRVTALSGFGLRQFELFEELLAGARPLAIVVLSALASRIYAHRRKPTFDPLEGHHWDEVAGRRVPVFFSGMLTGQRALDINSRDRLFWHVARSLGRRWVPSG